MSLIGAVQSKLSTLQAIPLAGPVLFSPIKALVSKVQIISGAVLGTVYAGATPAGYILDSRLGSDMAHASLYQFGEMVDGVGSLGYAFANVATLGVLGICVELGRPKQVVIVHHHHPIVDATPISVRTNLVLGG
jgi:hypothetical protein